MDGKHWDDLDYEDFPCNLNQKKINGIKELYRACRLEKYFKILSMEDK